MASALNTIALVFGVGIAGYFMVKVVLPKLIESGGGNIQLPSFQFPSFPQPQPQPQQPYQYQAPATAAPAPQQQQQQQPQTPTTTSTTGGGFTFSVVGDSRAQHTAAGQCVCGDNPALVLLTGDFMQGGPASQWQKTYSACSNRLNRIFASRGNHDGSGADYLKIFPLNKGKWSSMHKQGPIAFIACDTIADNPANEEPFFQQAQNDPAIKNIVVIMHEPVFTCACGGVSSDSNRGYHNMFTKYSKVKLVLSGHNHLYYRLKPINNILYVTNGTGGAADSSGAVVPGTEIHAYGCLKCSVTAGGGINCKWVGNDGKLGDSFGISEAGKITASGGQDAKQGAATTGFAESFYTYHPGQIDNPASSRNEDDYYSYLRYLRKPKRIFNNYVYNNYPVAATTSGLTPAVVGLKATGKKVAMNTGAKHRNGQRYNVNHSFTNYVMMGYFKAGNAEKQNMKTDGPNHGSCTSLPKCVWIEPQVVIGTGKWEMGSEWPHPKNHTSPCPSCKSVGSLSGGVEYGEAIAAFNSGGFRRCVVWVDKGVTGKWVKVLDETDRGQITNPTLAKRTLPTGGKGLEAEIRMHGGFSGTAIRDCYVWEIVPPAAASTTTTTAASSSSLFAQQQQPFSFFIDEILNSYSIRGRVLNN